MCIRDRLPSERLLPTDCRRRLESRTVAILVPLDVCSQASGPSQRAVFWSCSATSKSSQPNREPCLGDIFSIRTGNNFQTSSSVWFLLDGCREALIKIGQEPKKSLRPSAATTNMSAWECVTTQPFCTELGPHDVT